MTNAKVHPEDGQNPKKSTGKHPGPTPDRSCTDLFFLLLFVAYVGGMVAVASIASKIGKPERLVRGVDTYGNLCGATNSDVSEGGAWRDMSSKRYLFFGNPSEPKELQRCVERCPNNWSPTLVTIDDVLCREGYVENVLGVWRDTYLRGCFSDCQCFITYPSINVLNRCIPAPSITKNFTANAILAVEQSEIAKEMLSDVYTARFVILACAGIALVLGFVWLIMLRLCGGFIVWTTLLVVLFALGACGFLGLYYGDRAKAQYEIDRVEGNSTTRQKWNYIMLFCVGGVFALLFVLMFLSLIFMRSRIKLALIVVKEAARTLGHVPGMLLLPLVVFVLLAGFIAAWIVVFLYLGTASTPRFRTTPLYSGEPLRLLEYVSDSALRRLQAYHLFGGLWVVQFLLAFCSICVAGAAAHHYFAEGSGIHWPLITSVWYALRYNLGTIAFGSLTIAIVQFIRIMLVFAESHLKAAKNSEFARFVLRCLGYLFACLERFLKFISRNAYIMTAINGHGFCRAAKDAYNLLVQHALQLIAVQFVSAFLIVLGKLVIIAATGVAAFIWLKSMALKFWVIPLILVLLIAFAIAALFMGVYEIIIDAIFLCVCEDIEHHEGSFMGENLRAFVTDHKGDSAAH